MKFRTLVSKIFDYRGKTPKKIGYDWNNNGTIIAISAKNIKNQQLINLEKSHRGDERLYQAWMKDGDVKPGDVLLTSEAPLGESYQVKVDERFIISQRIFGLRPNTEVVDVDYFAALIASRKFRKLLGSRATGTTVLGIKQSELLNLDIELPSIETQKKIGVLMRVLNEKIVNEQLINDNLAELIDVTFKKYLSLNSEFLNELPASKVATVQIGKTPPRKETKWFSKTCGVKWASIADMGGIQTFLDDTKEYLTQEAIEYKKVSVANVDDILLSFKLTVGRVALLSERMATNEAIAQFKEPSISKYWLYEYLKNFKYAELGSTSSIATAINSKIVKTMPVKFPNRDIQDQFDAQMKPLFEKIQSNNFEKKALIELRDTLLLKLFNANI